jgi:methionine-rich copper-binding protein CopC
MSRIGFAPRHLAIAAVLGAAAALAIAAPAAAHSSIIDSTPADGAEITEAPDVFSVTANEDLADLTGSGEGFALRVVFLPTGEDLSTGELTIDGPTLSTPGVPLDPGPYLLEYQVVSADGHPISGEIAFTVAGEAATPTAEPEPLPEVSPPSAEPTPIDIVPINVAVAGPPGWLGGAVAVAMLAIGGIAAAASRRR